MVVSLALIMVLSAVAFADGIGAFSVFKNGIGAQALAMGGAFVAVCDDAMVTEWKLVGLVQVNLSGTFKSIYCLDTQTNSVNLGVGLDWDKSFIDGQFVGTDGRINQYFTCVENGFIGTLATNVLIDLSGAEIDCSNFDSVVYIDLTDSSCVGTAVLTCVDTFDFVSLQTSFYSDTSSSFFTFVDTQLWSMWESGDSANNVGLFVFHNLTGGAGYDSVELICYIIAVDLDFTFVTAFGKDLDLAASSTLTNLSVLDPVVSVDTNRKGSLNSLAQTVGRFVLILPNFENIDEPFGIGRLHAIFNGSFGS